jgi:hypothetical protein
MADQPYTEADVERIAEVIEERFGDRVLDVWPQFRPEARVALDALAAAGRLLPEGAELIEHWGVRLRDGHTVDYQVREGPARRLAASGDAESLLHRYITMWRPAESGGIDG